MSKFLTRFDAWVADGPFDVRDVSIYRVLYASLALLTFPRIQYLSDYPMSLFNPPPGPFRLFSELPPAWFLGGLEIAIVAGLSLILVGLWTRAASVATALLLVLAFGLTYSFGKIDHTILMVAVPLVLAFSGWGGKYSADSLRQQPPIAVRQWTLRLLALLVGLGFLTAAAPKILTGWLDPSTQATQGHFLVKHLFEGKDSWLVPLAYEVRPGWVWEPLDWVTIVLEVALVFSVLNWRAFRIVLSVACLFHVGVLLLFNISFNTNVMAYGAFVSWFALVPRSRLRLSRERFPPKARLISLILVVPVVAAFALSLPSILGTGGRLVVTTAIVLAGGVVSAAYLSHVVYRMVSHKSRGARL